MNILVSFAPFIAFAVLTHFGLTALGLWAGAIVAAVLILRERFMLGRSVKFLELGALVLFGALAIITSVFGLDWTIARVRLVVDGGLLAIVLVSLAIGSPFTLQYAREGTPPAIWSSPEFLAVNRRITWVWAAAFAALVVADLAMAFLPQLPHVVPVLVTVAALYLAFRYTREQSKPPASG